MSARFLVIAATALAMTGAAVAEPPKPQAPETNQPADRPAEVVLASADQANVPAPADQQSSPAPAKRPRAARVTTCRCGEPDQH